MENAQQSYQEYYQKSIDEAKINKKGKVIIDDDQCNAIQINLAGKLRKTIYENEMNILKDKEKEKEIEEKFNFFSDKICEILIVSNDIFEEYKSSESLKNLKNSDEIRKVMKEYLANLEKNELLTLLDKKRDFKFNEDIESIIQSETMKNIDIFIEEYKTLKKVKALKIIGEIKSDFETNFKDVEFHTKQFEEKIDKMMVDFCFENEHVKKIKDIITKIMKQKFIELINQELKYI